MKPATRHLRVDLYAGPSIRPDEIRALFTAQNVEIRILAPVEQGDLLRSALDPPDVIGIIDGYFYQVPSVLHKEILLMLEQGVRVLGASSLGALRAAELDVLGMEGVGRIYRMLADGRIDGDDEVAVRHGPAELGFRMLTVPLVNVRETLRRASEKELLSLETASAVLSSAKSIHFGDRTWQTVREHLRVESLPPDDAARFDNVLASHTVDVKHEDAVELIRLISDRISGTEPWPEAVPVQVHRSKYLHYHERDYVGHRNEKREIPDVQVLKFQKLLDPEFPEFVERIARQVLLADESRERGIATEPIGELISEFCQRESLESEAALKEWLRQRGLLADDLTEWLLREHRRERLFASVPEHSRQTREDVKHRERELVDSACRRLGIDGDQLPRFAFWRQTVAWEVPLIQALKVESSMNAARRQLDAILDTFDDRFSENPVLWMAMQALGEFTNDVIEEWACAMWDIDRNEFSQELKRRLFFSRNEFTETARMAHLHVTSRT